MSAGSSFNAKDAAAATIKIAAMFDSINSIYYPNMLPNLTRVERILDTNGDGTGATNANGDYSSVADDFYIEPPAGQIMMIHRMIFLLEDNSALRAERYTATNALANGVDLIHQVNTVETSLTPEKIQNLVHYAGYCHDLKVHTFGAGNQFATARWTFDKAGTPIVLNGATNDKLIVRLNDDLTGLVDHVFHVQGHLFS